MSKKNLNADGLFNELKGGSSFFPMKKDTPTLTPSEEPKVKKDVTRLPVNQQTSNQTSLQDSIDASKHASTLAIKPDIIECIRKVVKTPAKEEVLYVRVTKEEKDQLGDIEYTYHRQGIDTSANELGRIAVNFLIEDYKANGENSILAKVLTALHA
jgi:hypothetical protein